MNWFAGLKTKKLSVAWEYTTKGNLWRLLPSGSGHIVIEDRDIQQKSVSFACLDYATGNVLWKDVQLSEKWWITIEAIHRDVLFLHEYVSPDMPEHKKIFAVDINTGRTRWSNPDMKFFFAHEDSVYAAKVEYEQRRFYEIDLRNGAVLQEVDDQYLGVLRETVTTNSQQHVDFPRAVNSEYAEDELLKISVQKATAKKNNISFVEYLNLKDYYIFGYYENMSFNPSQQMFRQYLTIVEKENGKMHFNDIVNNNVVMAVPDTFFGMGSYVYYVKNKNTLRAINLSTNEE